jgi:hypothetical protein
MNEINNQQAKNNHRIVIVKPYWTWTKGNTPPRPRLQQKLDIFT